ncbi:uncharacterized protein FFM5_06100 [Fusarium fujikuroi]|nr:uncharacterized protein FFM5_06100 [Fusarium fujikuroi]
MAYQISNFIYTSLADMARH